MINRILAPFLAVLSLTLVACSDGTSTPVTTSTGTLAVPSSLVTFGNEAAAVLQWFNTGAQAALPTADALIALMSKNGDTVTNDTQYAALAASLIQSAANAQKSLAGSTTANQAAFSAAIAPTVVASLAANVASTTSTTP